MTKEERDTKLQRMRAERKKLKMPRDWSILPSYASHVIQGLVSGYILMHSHHIQSAPLAILALALILIYQQYQHSSFLRKSDTVGTDLCDHGVGVVIGILVKFIENMLPL